MTEALAQTVDASVIVLSVPGYGKRAVADQIALRQRLDEEVAVAIADLAPADRLVVDASDGVAILFLGGPHQAMSAVGTLATRLAVYAGSDASPFTVSVGATLGPVRLAEENGSVGVAGDGIAVAEAIAGFAEAGQILASRTFYEAAVAASPQTASSFKPLGTRVDANVRAHEVFLLDPPGLAPAAAVSARPSRVGRRTLLIAVITASVVVAAGFGVRELLDLVAAQQPPPQRSEVKIAVSPWAEVSVDGIFKGKSPPLQALDLSPGRHLIEFKHPAHKPYSIEVDIKPSEDLVVHYAFPELRRPHPRSPWRRFRDQLGF